MLATGCYDGNARIWTKTGDLVHTLAHHKRPLFSLRWNPQGNFLLSGSMDKSSIVWDAASGQVSWLFGQTKCSAGQMS